MVVVAGCILGGILVAGGGAAIGALAASKSGNESRTIQKAINEVSTTIKKEIDTMQENNAKTTNITIQKTSVKMGNFDIDASCCQNVNCSIIKLKQTSDSKTKVSIIANQESLNQLATNVANKLTADQKATTEQTTSALGSLLAAGNKSATDSEIRNTSKTKIENKIRTSLKNTIDSLQKTDQEATIDIGNIHIGCSIGSKIGNAIFGNKQEMSGGLSIADIEQGSISAIAASIAAKQVVQNIVNDTAKVEASSEQTAKTTQKAGDMTMIAVICAIGALGVFGAKYLKSKDKKGPKLYRGSRCDNMKGPSKAACLEAERYKTEHGVSFLELGKQYEEVPLVQGSFLSGKGYRSLKKSFLKNKQSIVVALLILWIVFAYSKKSNIISK